MPALNYKKEFAEAVRKKQKCCTVRALRKRPFKEGIVLYHYTGMRTSSCIKLLENKAVAVFDIAIESEDRVYVNRNLMKHVDLRTLAQIDGFEEVEPFINYFKTNHGFPFKGQLIMWNEIYSMGFKKLYAIN